MPTAAQFDRYTAEFEAQHDQISATANGLSAVEAGEVVGGSLDRALLMARSARVIAACTAAKQQCLDQAGECRRRAHICRAYTQAFDDYLYRLVAYDRLVRLAEPGDWVGWRPIPPVKPAAWVERG
jgi:hypothetical protein